MTHSAIALHLHMQLLVVGPWPYGFAEQLYRAVVVLATDILGLRLVATHLVCPWCRTAIDVLASIQNKARSKHATEPTECFNDCSNKPAAGPLSRRRDTAWSSFSDEESDDLVLGIEGFSVWSSGLQPRRWAPSLHRQFEMLANSAADQYHQTVSFHSLRGLHMCRMLLRCVTWGWAGCARGL